MMSSKSSFNFDKIHISNPETNTFPEIIGEEDATSNFQHHFSYFDESLFLSPIGAFLHPSEHYNLSRCQKRQKFSHEELHSSLQDLTTPTVLPSNYLDDVTCVDLPCEKKGNKNSISPQSIAARERRRKISEKTQKLGKLVPGGSKMNTAEMFHAAAKYVKFLRVQVEMLQLMNSFELEDKAEPLSEMLGALVVSPFIQEKLYTEERCFVSKETLITLTNLEDVQSRPIIEHLKQLIRSS